MSNEEANKVLEELYEVRPEKLNDKAKRLFEAIMKIADERDSVKADLYEANNRINDLLDLVKQNDKEIEHQKEKRENQKQELAILNEKQKEFNKLVNTVNSYKGQFKRQQKEIEELKKPKYVINCETNEITKLTNDIVSKDKIKAKIEDILNSENSEAIEKLIEWQSLLEKE